MHAVPGRFSALKWLAVLTRGSPWAVLRVCSVRGFELRTHCGVALESRARPNAGVLCGTEDLDLAAAQQCAKKFPPRTPLRSCLEFPSLRCFAHALDRSNLARDLRSSAAGPSPHVLHDRQTVTNPPTNRTL